MQAYRRVPLGRFAGSRREVLRKLEMNDETDVRLVIPHAQLHGGGKHPGITGHAACDEERQRHQEQVKRRGWQAQVRNTAGDGRLG